MWQKKARVLGMNWESAISYCKNLNLGGYSDWVLPETEILWDMIDKKYLFESSNRDMWYWSSPMYDGIGENKDFKWAWTVGFDNSFPEGQNMVGGAISNQSHVRCVRGGKQELKEQVVALRIKQEKERKAKQELALQKKKEKEMWERQALALQKKQEKERKAKQELALQQKKEKERKERLDRPKNELGSFYQSYVTLKKCHEVRKGYALVHVNSVEMGKIKSWAKPIEKGIFKKFPKVKSMKEQIWEELTKTIHFSSGHILYLISFEKFIGGVPEMTNNFSEWNVICDIFKTNYNKLIKTYGGGGTAKKDF